MTTYERAFVALVAEQTCRQDARERSRTDSRGFAVEAPAYANFRRYRVT